MGECRRPGASADTRLLVEDLWREHCRLARKHFRLTGELHTFAPRRLVNGEYIPQSADDPLAIKESVWRGLHHPQVLFARNRAMAEAINDHLKLPPPFPVALSKTLTSRYGFYCTTESGRFCFHNFHSTYAAKKFLDFIIDGREYKWLNDDEIELDNGTRIRGERPGQLEEALLHQLTPKEAKWEIPYPDVYYYKSFLGRAKLIYDKETGQVIDEVERPKKTRKIDPEKLIKRKREKVKTGQHITIAAIAEELKRSPRDCRAALRALKIPKPEHGWAWPPSEAEQIKSRLRRRFGLK